jgi:hypothetical protein
MAQYISAKDYAGLNIALSAETVAYVKRDPGGSAQAYWNSETSLLLEDDYFDFCARLKSPKG